MPAICGRALGVNLLPNALLHSAHLTDSRSWAELDRIMEGEV